MKHFMVDKKETEILRLLFKRGACSEEETASILKGIDLDNESFEFLLMLAVLGKKQDWRFFPDEIPAPGHDVPAAGAAPAL